MKKNTLKQKIVDDYRIEVPDYWKRIQDAIGEAEIQDVPHLPRFVPFYRIAAAIISMAIIITGGLFGVKHLFNSTEESPNTPIINHEKDTHIRIGQLGTMKAAIERSYTFEEAYNESALVVEAIITEWLGELDQDGLVETTYFRAEIVNEYKNILGLQLDDFILLQEGNSKWTYNGYPLFKIGDRLLLPLIQLDPIEYPEFCIEGENCFTIVGGQLSDMLIVEEADGTEVVLKRNLFFNFNDIDSLMKPDATDIISGVLSEDPVLSEAGVTFECAYSMRDLENYMDGIDEVG